MRRLITFVLSVLMLLAAQPYAFALQTDAAGVSTAVNEMESVEWILENCSFVSSDVKTVTTDQQEEIVFYVDTYAVTEVKETSQAYLMSGSQGCVDYTTTAYELWSLQPRGIGSSEYGDYDASGAIFFRLTVDYTDITYKDVIYRRITNVSGLYSIDDTQMTVAAHSYEVGQSGKTYPSGDMSDAFTYSLTVPLYTWTRTVSSSVLPPLNMRAETANQGAKYHYTIERIPTGSTWSGYVTVTTVGGLYDIPEA